jgi:pyruvate carboxylase
VCIVLEEVHCTVFRAATELDITTIAIYSNEDGKSVHRYKADEAYKIGKGKSPVGAYLGYEEIVNLAKYIGVDGLDLQVFILQISYPPRLWFLVGKR